MDVYIDNIYIYIYIYKHTLIDKCMYFLSLSTESASKQRHANLMNTPRSLPLILLFPPKKSRVPWKNGWFQGWGRTGTSQTCKNLFWQKVEKYSMMWQDTATQKSN